MGPSRLLPVTAICIALLAPDLAAQAPDAKRARVSDPAAVLDARVAAAEAALRDGELEIADSRYRELLFDAWMVMGELHVAAGRLEKARDAFRRATASAVDATSAFHALAVVQLQLGDAADAVPLLTKLAGRNPRDHRTRRLLAQAQIANGEPKEAVQTLEEARAVAPDDLELAFLLASGYLQLKKVEAAEPLLARLSGARPIPETHVLIGRTYRDAGFYDRARAAFEKALAMNPRTRRAHYYLGTLAVIVEGDIRLDDAIREFREELKVAPDDPLVHIRLGMALVEARRPAEALQSLERASRAASPIADVFHYLGRAQLALDRPQEAIQSFRRALELSRSSRLDDMRRGNIHFHLGMALRRTGATEEAASHFDRAKEESAHRADADREQLARYLADAPASGEGAAAPLVVNSHFSGLSSDQRAALERRSVGALAGAYMNLGVMQAQARRFGRAAEFFAQAADADLDFPQVQYSLGVAYFNAAQYENAMGPLGRALAADPSKADVRRMLALASLNAGSYEKAAELLASDARRDSDPSLQYAYALALVRSNRAAEAEAVFAQLLAHHGTTPELQVLVGQAHAQQGDFDSAIASLQGALKVKPEVADAHATLGMIYLQQGKLAEARTALRAGLEAHPGDVHAAHTLATVLDLEGQPEEAAAILRSILRSRPDFANAHYLLGKILLARGAADEAVEQLEAGVRLAPEDPNIHYQLAQAYRKQGRTELADKRLEIYQQLKEKRRSR
jgi:tetratricopeptide (TPR) repeat protein